MARPVRKPQIEPLSERAWQRVEDRVFEQLQTRQVVSDSPRSRRLALWFAAASLIISIGAVIQVRMLASSSSLAGSNSVGGGAASTAQLGTPTPASGDAARPTSGHASTGNNEPEQGRVARSLSAGNSEPRIVDLGGSVLTLTPRTEIELSGSDAEGWLVVVETGVVGCAVAPRQGRPDFVVRAGDTEVRVVGTRFDVSNQAGEVAVSVQEGKVLVRSAGRETLLAAGEDWNLSDVGSEPRAEPANQPAARAERRVRSSAAARQDYELAASLESTDPARALDIYRRLSNGGGSWAATALYARARLLEDKGRNSEAAQLLELYLKRYPNGRNAADARELLKR